jgi:glycosyltransferase involved in cell wall biosynthesis
MNTLALCIPAFNAEKYLPRLLISAKEQNVPFHEILVYDDCSTDKTTDIAIKFGAKVITGNVNKGCSHAKNILASATKCNWIHFHDADDIILPNFTELAFKWMDNPFCPDIVLFDYEYRDGQSGSLLNLRRFDKEALETDPIEYAILEQINPFCGLYKKEKFLSAGGYDTDPLVLYNEDVAFHISMAVNKASFSVEHEVSIVNFKIANSMSGSNGEKCALAQYHVLEKTASSALNYHYQIAYRLWDIITSLGVYKNWIYVRKALLLSKQLGYRHSINGNSLFKLITIINPFFAIWFREQMIRIFKRKLRANV